MGRGFRKLLESNGDLPAMRQGRFGRPFVEEDRRGARSFSNPESSSANIYDAKGLLHGPELPKFAIIKDDQQPVPQLNFRRIKEYEPPTGLDNNLFHGRWGLGAVALHTI